MVECGGGGPGPPRLADVSLHPLPVLLPVRDPLRPGVVPGRLRERLAGRVINRVDLRCGLLGLVGPFRTPLVRA
jgi:hypothetical protein